MRCPNGHEMNLSSPDYGRGAEFKCYRCDVYGARYVSSSPEARAESDASRAQSGANAALLAGAPCLCAHQLRDHGLFHCRIETCRCDGFRRAAEKEP
jgi:hypothetical protein